MCGLALTAGACAAASNSDPADASKAELDADLDRPDARPRPDADLSDAAAIDGGVFAGPNDSCAQTRPITAGATLTGNTTGYFNDLEPTSSCTGFGPDGADAIYEIDVAAGKTITATVTPDGWDASVYIVPTCVQPPTCLAGTDADPDAAPAPGEGVEVVSFTTTTAGTYYIVVDAWTVDVVGAFTLKVTVQ